MEATTPDQIPSPAEEAAGLIDDSERGPRRVRTAEELKARALHRDVILPSGAIVDIRLPNLPKMIKSGAVPNDLIDAAIKHQNVEEMTRETLLETWEFTRFIVPETVASPEITSDDVDDMDLLDIELIANLASRRTDVDAVGRQLGGLDTQESFRQFRAESSLRAALGGF